MIIESGNVVADIAQTVNIMLHAPFGYLADGRPRKKKFRRRGINFAPPSTNYIANVPKHPTAYCFDEVADLVGPGFASQLVAVWPIAFAADVSQYTEKRRSTLIGFCRYLVAEATKVPDGPQAALVSGLMSGAVIAASFVHSTVAYCALLHDRGDRSVVASENKRTRNNIINVLGATFKELARQGLLPVDSGMTAIPTGPYEPRTPTIAELSAEGELGSLDSRAAFGRLLQNPRLAERLGIAGNASEVLSAQELASAMVQVLQIRLEALRACAVADLEVEEQALAEGKALVVRVDLPSPEQIMSAILQWQPKTGIETLLTKFEGRGLPILPGKPPQRLLAYVVRVMAPHYANEFKVIDLHPRLALAISGSGGLLEVSRRFEGTMVAKTAAHLIVLIDTMFNVSVCDRLAAEPFTGRTVRGKMEIVTLEAIKRRARHKVVTGSIPNGSSLQVGDQEESHFLEVKRVDGKRSGIWAINTWLKLSASTRARACRDGEDARLYMWILSEGGKRYRGAARRPHFTSDCQAWREFLAKHADDPFIGGLPITREMLRVSSLQARSGPEDNSGQVMQPLAQHESARTTHGYANSKWMRAVLSEQIRTFQNLLEASAGADIADIARTLGISADLLLSRRDLALQNGLGFFCANPLAGERAGTLPGELCDRLEDCPGCRMRKFVPSPDALEALWLFGKALRDQRASWEATRPERWKVIWLPWLAIVTAAENVINSGRFKIRYDRAVKSAALSLSSGNACVPVLW